MERTKFIFYIVFFGILSVIALIIGLGSLYTVDQSERGVITRWGKVVETAEPGLGYKFPLITSVNIISIGNRSITFDKIEAYSNDQQPAQMKVSVGLHIPADKVVDVYTKYGTIQNMADRLISRHVPTQVENVFGQYTAVLAVQKREEFVRQVTNELRKVLENEPVIIDSVNIENIHFSDEYEASIEERMKAEVNVQKTKQLFEIEKVNANIAIQQAKGKAESEIELAVAEAKKIQLKGEAEATAIQLRGEALKQNPLLIELITAERWDGKLPQTMVPGSAVPFINTK